MNLAQRFSAGKSGKNDSSPGGTTEFSRIVFRGWASKITFFRSPLGRHFRDLPQSSQIDARHRANRNTVSGNRDPIVQSTA